ncbi:MAG: sterol desaturase family protein [Rhodothermales bacterium]|nr:sterol desaturase family protein [Rhodothermales bacterium]
MPELSFEVPNLVNWAIPAFLLLLVAEAVFSALDQRALFEVRDTFASLAMGLGNVLSNLVVKAFIFGVYWFVYDATGFFRDALGPDRWYAWVLLFFAEDLSYYWFHRISHGSRYFWASHVVHHSSQKYNLSTALRQTWTGNLSGSFVFWLWLPLLGFHPVMVMTLQSVSLIYQFWIHTEAIGRLPRPIEWVFNTPSHHRVHHASDVKYLDRNHAGVLIIWDRLFGTFQPEEERPTYGLTTNIDTYNPFRIAFHEWAALWRDVRRPLPWRDRLGYLFGPPGWSHDGSRRTTRQLREELARRNAVSPVPRFEAAPEEAPTLP